MIRLPGMSIDDLFAWAVVGSLGTHAVGLAMVSGLGFLTPSSAPSPAPVPIEVVKLPASEPPAPPPKPQPVKQPKVVPPPKVVLKAEPAPIQPSQLIDEKTALDPSAPSVSPTTQHLPNAVRSLASAVVPEPREGGPAGAGELFATGDIPVRPGPGTGAGSGGPGRSGTGLAARGNAAPVGPAGVTSFARPLGGYQTLPQYPESARSQGLEGVTVLRFVVEADGHVGAVEVDRSAGSPSSISRRWRR